MNGPPPSWGVFHTHRSELPALRVPTPKILEIKHWSGWCVPGKWICAYARHVSLESNERVDKLARDAITAGVKVPEINVPLEDFKVAKKERGLKTIR
ncbi:hypothetical protein J6590_082033 [Homalodisca vitripennis]|nr:hypothetical protein J6590_082033 [Homalodisca vitripennis]